MTELDPCGFAPPHAGSYFDDHSVGAKGVHETVGVRVPAAVADDAFAVLGTLGVDGTVFMLFW